MLLFVMLSILGHSGGYRKTFSFGLTCLIYHATTTFCRRNFDYHNDQLGKTVGQMEGAARSARQNLVEGSTRAGTSRETELRLLDVARASLAELAGDYEAFLTDRRELPWSECDSRTKAVLALEFDPFDDGPSDRRHNFVRHLLQMRERFAPWLEAEDPVLAANAILVMIDRAGALIFRQMEKLGEEFRQVGGFTEHLSKVRLEYRDQKAANSAAPRCPQCGGPMRKVVARKGANAGNPFWGCCAYPNCQGTRPWQFERPPAPISPA